MLSVGDRGGDANGQKNSSANERSLAFIPMLMTCIDELANVVREPQPLIRLPLDLTGIWLRGGEGSSADSSTFSDVHLSLMGNCESCWQS